MKTPKLWLDRGLEKNVRGNWELRGDGSARRESYAVELDPDIFGDMSEADQLVEIGRLHGQIEAAAQRKLDADEAYQRGTQWLIALTLADLQG